MPQLNPDSWFIVMITTWTTMMLLLTKLTNTPTYSTPTQADKPTHIQPIWPW